MREITKHNLGIPFYDHLNGLEWKINEDEATSLIVANIYFMKGGINNMLMPQIEFAKLKETRRHNLETEALGWANNVLEHLKYEEAKRHNLATEDIEMKKLAETIRHNLVSENQKDRDLGIQQFIANTRAGELAWKQVMDPQKLSVDATAAAGRLLAGQAAVQNANTKEVEATIASRKAQTESRRADIEQQKVNSQVYKNLRDIDINQKEFEISKKKLGVDEKNAETNKQRMINDAFDSLQKAYENSQTPFPSVDTSLPKDKRSWRAGVGPVNSNPKGGK